MSECTGVVPEPPAKEPDTEPIEPEEPEKKSNVGMIIGVIAIVVIGGAGYFYFKVVRGKKQKGEDPDFYDDVGDEGEADIYEDAEAGIGTGEEKKGGEG